VTFPVPYFAVIFVSKRTAGDRGYAEMANRMVELGSGMAGFLGIDSVRDESGAGITVSYWKDEESIAAWRAHAEHLVAQERGRSEWYEAYDLHVARVERSYSGPGQ
jgi:heme-degrading monooxygenase HmoA